MEKSLLIVESPAKARTINKYLGKGFTVIASMGHIKDLPPKELGINIKNDFRPRYIISSGKRKIAQQIKQQATNAGKIYIATDPDREGEAIAYHIAELIDGDKKVILRVLFNEITKNSVKEGIKHPTEINKRMVSSQQARRVLDRLVGYQVSPFLWRILYSGLSAGRVQSVAMRLICDREDEIEKFVPKEYWTIQAELLTEKKEKFSAALVKISGEKAEIPNEKTCKNILKELESLPFRISKVEDKKVSKSPPAPYITSTLQQEASNRLRLSPQRTMSIAQQLYEGVDIDGETTGLITYMRTDSTRLSSEAIGKARGFIKKTFGGEYLPAKGRQYVSRKKIQDAHEAIRPTEPSRTPESLKDQLNKDQLRLYTIIWKRFMASQMSAARYKQRSIEITAGKKYLFKATGSQLIFDGFLRLYQLPEGESEEKIKIPEKISAGETCNLQRLIPEQHFTQPPPRFTESSLIKALDALGIGRPSTYATILTTLYQRKYVQKIKNALVPSDIGRIVTRILVEGMPSIFNVKFTAEMEESLDRIESGESDYLSVMRQFYDSFRDSLDKMEARRQEIKLQLQEATDEICEKCGSPMVIKWSKKGRFLACSAFPKCHNARPLEEPKDSGEKRECPECGSEMRIKEGRFGRFWACSRYPKCKHTEPFTLNISCPREGCNGKLTEKKSRKGKLFYSCTNYPDCDFATWDKPIDQECENCHYPFLALKSTKAKGEFLRCPSCKTEYPLSEELTETEK